MPFRKRRTASVGRDIVGASDGLEPSSVRLEGARVQVPALRPELEQVAGVKPAKATLAMSPRITL